jgi:hypothetical protein
LIGGIEEGIKKLETDMLWGCVMSCVSGCVDGFWG